MAFEKINAEDLLRNRALIPKFDARWRSVFFDLIRRGVINLQH